jgi:hypothetical protein
MWILGIFENLITKKRTCPPIRRKKSTDDRKSVAPRGFWGLKMDQLIVVSNDNVVELPFVRIIPRKKISIQKTTTTAPVDC